MEILIVTLILIASLAFTFSPIYRQKSELNNLNESAWIKESLETDKTNIYKQIIELDFDYKLGNIEDDDYEESRATLKTQAAEVISKLTGTFVDSLTSCPSCKNPLSPEANFCTFCGSKIK